MLVEPVSLLCVEASCSLGVAALHGSILAAPEEPEAGACVPGRGPARGGEGSLEPAGSGVGQAAGCLGLQRVGRVGCQADGKGGMGKRKGLAPRSSATLTPTGTLPYF